MCPHFFFLQLVARGGRRAYPIISIRSLHLQHHTHIALSADHLVAVVLACQSLERRLNDTSSQSENQVESRFLLDVVV